MSLQYFRRFATIIENFRIGLLSSILRSPKKMNFKSLYLQLFQRSILNKNTKTHKISSGLKESIGEKLFSK